MIPELEDFQEKKIFSPAEVKSIVKKRTAYEYKFKRQSPQLNDFLSCIQYEMTLDKLRHKRKKNLGIRKVLASDYGCKSRVHFSYERALRKFGSDVELWLEYIGFAERTNSSKQLGKIFPRALQMHPNKPELWVKAALWEFRTNQNVDASRVMFQRGLRFNKSSQGLWLHFFKMEMEYIMKLLDRKKLIAATFAATNLMDGDDSADDSEEEAEKRAKKIEEDIQNGVALDLDEKDKVFLSGIIPRAVYKNAVASKELKDNLSFRLKFLDLIPNELLLTKELDYQPLIQAVYESIAADFPDNEAAWEKRADRALEVASLKQEQAHKNGEANEGDSDNDNKDEEGSAVSSGKRKRSDADSNSNKKQRINGSDGTDRTVEGTLVEASALGVWEEAVGAVASANIWEKYASFLQSRITHYSEHNHSKHSKSQSITAAIDWFASRLITICQRAFKLNLCSEKTFIIWATTLLQQGKIKACEDVCKTSLKRKYCPTSLPLWRLILHVRRIIYTFDINTLSNNSSDDTVTTNDNNNKKKDGWKDLQALYTKAIDRFFAALSSFARDNDKKDSKKLTHGVISLHSDLFDLNVARTAQFSSKPSSPSYHTAYEDCNSSFQRAVSSFSALHEKEGFNLCSQRYLEWVVSGPIIPSASASPLLSKPYATRISDACDFLVKIPSITLPVLEKCIQIQLGLTSSSSSSSSSQSSLIDSRIRKSFELAVSQHGAYSVELWLSFVNWLMSSKKFEQSNKLYWRATKSLNDEHQSAFIVGYNSLKSKF